LAAKLDPVRLSLESLVGLPFSWGVHAIGNLLPFWAALLIAMAAGFAYWWRERRRSRREIGALKSGQTVEEVEAILGPADMVIRRHEGNLLVQDREYRQDGKHYSLRFVGGRLITYSIEAEGDGDEWPCQVDQKIAKQIPGRRGTRRRKGLSTSDGHSQELT
jgi:hypothetical protein